MEAKDFRIGNLIYLYDSLHTVRLGTLENLITNPDKHHYKPVPLTEDWLLKFGFQKINHIYGYSFYTLSKSKINKCHIDIYENKTVFVNYMVDHCKYVHQLQNLYFALTSEELTIKEQAHQ